MRPYLPRCQEFGRTYCRLTLGSGTSSTFAHIEVFKIRVVSHQFLNVVGFREGMERVGEGCQDADSLTAKAMCQKREGARH